MENYEIVFITGTGETLAKVHAANDFEAGIKAAELFAARYALAQAPAVATSVAYGYTGLHNPISGELFAVVRERGAPVTLW